MTTVLVFREGQCGNFLKLLLESPNDCDVKFRISDRHDTDFFNLTLTHAVDYETHKKQFEQVLRILPTKKIYLAIYNNFMKKLIVEEPNLDFKNWPNNLVNWYDRCYCNINEYYQLITNDIATNQYSELINFDYVYDKNYLEFVLSKYFNQAMTPKRHAIVEEYANLQLQIDLDTAALSMQDIVAPITDTMFRTNPWFFSYCVYKYEKNNNLSELNRKWSIDNIKTIQTAHDLFKISTQY